MPYFFLGLFIGLTIAVGYYLIVTGHLFPKSGHNGTSISTPYAYMESVHAGSLSPWHIRQVPPNTPLKLGGGITTPSLCGKVTRGWDLRVGIHPKYNDHTCAVCHLLYEKAQRQALLNYEF